MTMFISYLLMLALLILPGWAAFKRACLLQRVWRHSRSRDEIWLHAIGILLVWNCLLPEAYLHVATASLGEDFDPGIHLVHQHFHPLQDYLQLNLLIWVLAAVLPRFQATVLRFGLRLTLASFTLAALSQVSFFLFDWKHNDGFNLLGRVFDSIWGERMYAAIIEIRGQIGGAHRSLGTPSLGPGSAMLLDIGYLVCLLTVLPFLLLARRKSHLFLGISRPTGQLPLSQEPQS